MTEIDAILQVDQTLNEIYLLQSVCFGGLLFALGWLAGHQR